MKYNVVYIVIVESYFEFSPNEIFNDVDEVYKNRRDAVSRRKELIKDGYYSTKTLKIKNVSIRIRKLN